MQIDNNCPFLLGNWRVFPQLNQIVATADNSQHQVSPKTMQLLQLLVDYHYQPVDLETIMADVWPGKVVADSSVYQAIAQLRKILNLDPEHSQYIERISSKGYRISDDITLGSLDSVSTQTDSKAPWKTKQWKLVGLTAMVIVSFSLLGLLWQHDVDGNSEQTEAHFEALTLAAHLTQQNSAQPLDQAKQLYQEVLQLDSDNVEALLGLCTSYRKLAIYGALPEVERDKRCQPLLDKAYAIQPDSSEVNAAMAHQAMEQGNVEQAFVLFNKAINQDSSNSQTWRGYGELLRRQNNIPEALEAHRTAFQLTPNDPQVLRALAYTHLNNRDLRQAQKYYQRSKIIIPNFTHTPLYDLDFYPLSQQGAKAYLGWHQQFYVDHIKKYPVYQYSHILLLLGLGQLQQAEEIIKQLQQTSRNQAFALYVKASIAWYKQQDIQAIALLKQRYQLTTEHNRYVMPYIMALAHSDHNELALKLFSKHFPHIIDSSTPVEQAVGQYLMAVSLLKANQQDHLRPYEALLQYRRKYKSFTTVNEILWQAMHDEHDKVEQLLHTQVKDGWLPDYNDNMFLLRHYRQLSADGEWQKLLVQQQRCIREQSLTEPCAQAAN